MAKKKTIKRIVKIPVEFWIEADSEELFQEAADRCKDTWFSTSCFGSNGAYHIDSSASVKDRSEGAAAKTGFKEYDLNASVE